MQKTIHSHENRKLITWLKNHRERQNLTMRQLAEKLETSHSFIGKVEQGERRLDVVEFIQYCEALDVSPVDGIVYIVSEQHTL